VNRLLRRIFTWKFVFYELFLPLLRTLGPSRYDAVLRWLGQVLALVCPGRRARLRKSLIQARDALDLDGRVEELWPDLAANTARFLARDYSLDSRSDAKVFERFEVRGYEHLERALAAGGGVLLVGSHLGAYIAGLHWLVRKRLPVRAMVQRPRHVSHEVSRWFDNAQGPYAQSELFLRRNLPLADAIQLLIRARAALRDGLALYLCGDIPWQGPNTRPGQFLGQAQRFLAIWTELAVLTRAPVFHVFCIHLPGGRFRLEFEAVGQVHSGEESEAVADYLKQLEARIATEPAQAVAHLLWPCFHPSSSACPAPRASHATKRTRPSRRNAVFARGPRSLWLDPELHGS
jgi:lauroyl/myristoyl acyltransferase